ncbi:hypothetical protein [Acinetobacter sp.]|uniref:hypothetical protein n=1 Tax=Acinetobacter sp. TaxID=472 RepID=UPI003890E636
MRGLIRFTDKAIMDLLLGQIQQLNPWLKVGDQMTAPVALVCNGKLVVDKDVVIPENLVRIKNVPLNAVPTKTGRRTAINVGTLNISLSDIENFRTSAYSKFDFHLTGPAYIHPYTLEVPARSWLEKYKVGDLVSVEYIDPKTFEITFVEVPLTQQMVDENSDVLFRFALSD